VFYQLRRSACEDLQITLALTGLRPAVFLRDKAGPVSFAEGWSDWPVSPVSVCPRRAFRYNVAARSEDPGDFVADQPDLRVAPQISDHHRGPDGVSAIRNLLKLARKGES